MRHRFSPDETSTERLRRFPIEEPEPRLAIREPDDPRYSPFQCLAAWAETFRASVYGEEMCRREAARGLGRATRSMERIVPRRIRPKLGSSGDC